MRRLRRAFMTVFGLEEEADFASLRYREIPEWNSIGHMRLVAEIESAYDIMMETDDILDMSSFSKAVEILAKYDVELED